jgi:hypothetical protein
VPWSIHKRGDQYCVIKDDDGENEGCHDTQDEAEAQRRALYASEASADTVTLGDVGEILFTSANGTTSTGTVTFTVSEAEEISGSGETEAPEPIFWEGILGFEGEATDDRRFLMNGEIGERELPLPLMIQTITDEGHRGAELGGRIDEIWRSERDDGVVEIWGRGPFDTSSDVGREGARLVEEEFLTRVSLDLAITDAVALDPNTLEPMEIDEMDFLEFVTADFVTGLKGTIMGATLVPFSAFPDAKVSVITASGKSISMVGRKQQLRVIRGGALTASAGPVKPPREWFEDPKLNELTPLKISKEGRVYGHLADWDGCHTGFQGICVPPFRSATEYAYFNVGEIETAEGDLVPCGKLMYCRTGNGHAPIEMTADEASRYYDDATKVGAFVRAGSDRFGTWLAGALRSDLNDLDIQHLRTHPPSGDWRPVKNGPSELVAAFAVPIPGFPIQRALVASADGEISAIITAPLEVNHEVGAKQRRRRKAMLSLRVKEVFGKKETPRAAMRKKALVASAAKEEESVE